MPGKPVLAIAQLHVYARSGAPYRGVRTRRERNAERYLIEGAFGRV
jgi:hypothetical protein